MHNHDWLINPRLYEAIYYWFIAVLTIITMFRYAGYTSDRIRSVDNFNYKQKHTIFLTIIVTLFIGLRPISGVFVDMMNYNMTFAMRQSSHIGNPDVNNNYLFNWILNYYSSNNYESTAFFFTIAAIYFSGIAYCCVKIFKADSFYALLIFLGAFSTFAYGTNGIKAGAAASVYLVGLALFKRKYLGPIFIIMSIAFHHAMILPVIAYFIVRFYHKPVSYLFFWCCCLILAASHVTEFQHFLGDISSEKGQVYLYGEEGSWGGKQGFRYDFILYSLVSVLIGWWVLIKHRLKSEFYSIIYCIYLLCNGIWMLCMYVPFTNRIAYLSWFLIPLVSSYPFFRIPIGPAQYKILNTVVGVYLVFSMIAVYFL